jgi:hypothetical protein
MVSNDRKLFVCYVPGLDRRHISADSTPFLNEFLTRNPTVGIRTFPSTELVPTLVTGVWPHEHGFWQVSLKPDVTTGALSRVSSLVPDGIVTTYQCLRHLLGDYELAAIPWRRRRHFTMHRFKYPRRRQRDLTGLGVESIFDWVGSGARYRFCQHWDELPALLDSIPVPGREFDLLELYAFDLSSHWNLDRTDVMRTYLHRIDDFMQGLAGRCVESNVTLLLLVDHGQEQIRRTIDLRRILKKSGVGREDYHVFTEIGQARLWFKTENARTLVTQALEQVEGVSLFSWREMSQFNVRFPDEMYGELYAIAEPGVGFFPHDFYHPIANLYLGLRDPKQRPRLKSPRHRASHGMLPDYASESGYLSIGDPFLEATREEMELIDFAPTVLDLLGRERPVHLRGKAAFQVPAHA